MFIEEMKLRAQLQFKASVAELKSSKERALRLKHDWVVTAEDKTISGPMVTYALDVAQYWADKAKCIEEEIIDLVVEWSKIKDKFEKFTGNCK